MRIYSIVMLLIPTIALGMHSGYNAVLSHAPYIQKVFKNVSSATVHTSNILFMNLVTEAAKNQKFKQRYLPAIQSLIRKTDFKREWSNIKAEPFYTMLPFIPWDGKNDNPRYQRVTLNQKEVNVLALGYSSKSIPPIHVIEFVGDTHSLLMDHDHHEAVLQAYTILMQE